MKKYNHNYKVIITFKNKTVIFIILNLAFASNSISVFTFNVEKLIF